MADNKRRGQVWRQLCALVLRMESGLPVEPRTPVNRRSQDTLTQPPASDILGLDDWAILTRAEHERDLSGNADAARDAARLDGKRWAAVAYLRNDPRPSTESYVVVDLATFGQVVAALQAHGAGSEMSA